MKKISFADTLFPVINNIYRDTEVSSARAGNCSPLFCFFFSGLVRMVERVVRVILNHK